MTKGKLSDEIDNCYRGGNDSTKLDALTFSRWACGVAQIEAERDDLRDENCWLKKSLQATCTTLDTVTKQWDAAEKRADRLHEMLAKAHVQTET